MNRIKVKIQNWLLKNLFNAISEDDILKYEKGKFLLRGIPLDTRVTGNFVSQANSILKSQLWKHLTDDIKYISNQRMYEKSTTIDDVIFGKAMLYNLDILERKLERLSKLK